MPFAAASGRAPRERARRRRALAPTAACSRGAAMSKRQAGVQLTKDDYERAEADDEDRYGPPIIPGTWQKADEETLKRRVIRKAKRPTAGAGGSLPLPPSNPFASVDLAPAAPAANPFAAVQLAAAPTSANPFANLQMLPAKAQKTSAESSVPFVTTNPFLSIVQPAAAPAADPTEDALRERLHAVRRARLHML